MKNQLELSDLIRSNGQDSIQRIARFVVIEGSQIWQGLEMCGDSNQSCMI